MKSVRVRIAVRVDAKGNWCSEGWSNTSDKNLLAVVSLHDDVSPTGKTFWLTCDVVLPEETIPVIEGKVEEVK